MPGPTSVWSAVGQPPGAAARRLASGVAEDGGEQRGQSIHIRRHSPGLWRVWFEAGVAVRHQLQQPVAHDLTLAQRPGQGWNSSD